MRRSLSLAPFALLLPLGLFVSCTPRGDDAPVDSAVTDSPVTPPTDTGSKPADAGTTDTGVAPVDTSAPPTDNGAVPDDAGAPGTDTGTVSMDSGAPADATVSIDATTPTDMPTTAPDGAPLPNLAINAPRITSSARFEYRDFTPTSCDVVEGCITTPGRRRLLRFDLETPNNGLGDAYLGVPFRGDPRFEESTCHGHRHFLGYALYSLRNSAGVEVAQGHKQSFCLLDSRRTGNVPTARATGTYSCGNQGISSGWSDIYGASLDCQYIDVTDVPAGEYRIHVDINRFHGIPESDYSDNTAEVSISIPAAGDAGTPEPFDAGSPDDQTRACATATTGLTRNCGWGREPVSRRCTAGSTVVIGCNAGCVPPLGSFTGDPMMRVCEGNRACSGLDGDPNRLGANDDSCPPAAGGTNYGSQVTFRCPASGEYTVMTGPYTAGMAFTCNLAVR